MDFALTSEQEMLRESARQMAARDFQPILNANDRDRALPKSEFLRIFKIVADQGIIAPRTPVDAGGSGMSMLDYGIMFEQIQPVVSMSMLSQDGCIARLNAECTPDQKKRFLPDLLAGRKIGCTGSTEPDAGSDPRGIKTRVERDGNSLVLNGRKMWVTNISICDTIIVTCLDRTNGAKNNRIVKVVVDREESPFDAREIDAIGLRQGLLGEAVFDNCHVPAENLIDSGDAGTQVLKGSWHINRIMVALQAVHLAQKAFGRALEYAKMRKQFGKTIAAHQLIQKNLSDMATAITASRLLCYHALARMDRGHRADGEAAMAKRFAQNACTEAVWQAMNMLGAMGLSREAGIEEMYRDIRMLPIPDGTNEILALIHGRELTEIGAFR
jgi:alkylation response protein AidB-like acyl-CoA dehydrogenase